MRGVSVSLPPESGEYTRQHVLFPVEARFIEPRHLRRHVEIDSEKNSFGRLKAAKHALFKGLQERPGGKGDGLWERDRQ